MRFLLIVIFLTSFRVTAQINSGFTVEWVTDLSNLFEIQGNKELIKVHYLQGDSLLLHYQNKRSGHSDTRDHFFRWFDGKNGEKLSNTSDLTIGDDFARDSWVDSDGNIYAIGNSQCFNNNHTNNGPEYLDFALLKYSKTGDLIWRKCYGSSADDGNFGISRIFPSGENEILVFAHISGQDGDASRHYGEDDIWVMKFNTDGELLFETNIGGSGTERVLEVVDKNNGSFYLITSTYSKDEDLAFLSDKTNQENYVVFQVNASGEILSHNFLFSPDSILGAFLTSAQLTAENDLSLTFGITDSVYTYSYPLVYVVSENGNKLSKRPYSYTELHVIEGQINNLGNGFSLYYGFNRSDYLDNNLGGSFSDVNETWLSLVDTNDDNIVWETRLPDSLAICCSGNYTNYLGARSLVSSPNENGVIYGAFDGSLFKLTPNTSTSISAEHLKEHQLAIYPNPNNTGILNTNLKADYSIIDLQGRLIKTFQQSTGLDVSEVQSGTYVLRHEGGATARVVIE